MRKNTTLILLLTAAAWLLGGCSSDSTAPDDSLPPLSGADVASQSGYMAMALIEVAPLSLAFEGGKTGDYTYEFGAASDIQGVVNLQFRLGGSSGQLVVHDLADWARAWAPADAPVTVDLVEGGIAWELSFDLTSDIDRDSDTATVDGGGTLAIGSYTATWSVAGLIVYHTDDTTWPSGGVMTFTNEGITAVITFDGDHTATIEVGGQTFIVNLENGSLTEA